MTQPAPLTLEGVHNFRALAPYALRGGGRIKPNMVFRSGAPDPMSEADAALLLSELSIACVLDVRHPDELGPAGASAHALIDRVRALSVFPETGTQQELIAELNGLYGTGPSPERYLHYLSVGAPRFVRVFELLADPATYPVLIHCTAGKDRTGVIVGMLMEMLGADDDDIANEYELSNADIDRLIAYLEGSGRQLEGSREEIRARLETPAAHMAGFIRLLRERHGGAAEYLVSQGLDKQAIEDIRGLLVEPA